MSFEATGRYALLPAPAGLTLVQDLLNTVAAGRPRQPDLLATAELAAPWLATAMRSWAAARDGSAPVLPAIGANELPALRRLRDAVRGGKDSDHLAPAPLTGGLSLTLDVTGRVRAVPRGTTAPGWLRSAVLVELLEAQQADTWRRLKVCRNDRCSVAFYDRSKNNSGVWHDARVCGNAVNLRASRARRSGRDVPRAPEEAPGS